MLLDAYPFSLLRRGRRGIVRWGLLVACVGTLCLANSAIADTVHNKRFVVQEHEGRLLLSVGFREMFTRELRARLDSGFATSVVMRVYLYPRQGGRPLAASACTLNVVYDLWEQIYRLKTTDPLGSRVEQLDSRDRVVDRLTSLWRFPLVKMGLIAPGQHYFAAVIAEVNPVRESMLREVRRWLRAPIRRPSVMGENFFGSFVSIFVNNRVHRAERTFKVRSQPFFRPETK